MSRLRILPGLHDTSSVLVPDLHGSSSVSVPGLHGTFSYWMQLKKPWRPRNKYSLLTEFTSE